MHTLAHCRTVNNNAPNIAGTVLSQPRVGDMIHSRKRVATPTENITHECCAQHCLICTVRIIKSGIEHHGSSASPHGADAPTKPQATISQVTPA